MDQSNSKSWPWRTGAIVFGLLAMICYGLSAYYAMGLAFAVGAGSELAFWVQVFRRPG